jgi:signal transduction histidine kinase
MHHTLPTKRLTATSWLSSKRFCRVDKARSREAGGSGLGLAICRHIAHAHGGDIQVESRINQGSTFRVQLPLYHYTS